MDIPFFTTTSDMDYIHLTIFTLVQMKVLQYCQTPVRVLLAVTVTQMTPTSRATDLAEATTLAPS